MTGFRPETTLANLVNDRLSDLGITPSELVHRLGFANVSKGLRRFDEYITTGEATSHLLKTLPIVLELATVDVEAAAATTRQQIADAEESTARERFHTHILVLARFPNGMRMPFFIQAFAHGQKVLPMADGFDRLSPSQQVRQAARIVRRHFGESRGKLSAWGHITGYRLQTTFDHAVLLNTDGTIREGFNREPEPPAPEIHLGGKRMPLGAFVGR